MNVVEAFREIFLCRKERKKRADSLEDTAERIRRETRKLAGSDAAALRALIELQEEARKANGRS